MNKAQALQIGSILGRCTVKNLGSLFLPIIQLKGAINKLSAEFDETQKEILNTAGIDVNPVNGSFYLKPDDHGSVQASTAMKALSEQQFEYYYQIFTAEDLTKIAEENPTLTVAEVTALYELVK